MPNWYEKLIDKFSSKTNPAQESIAVAAGSGVYSDASVSYTTAYEKLEVVNRGTNMIVSAASSMDYDIKEKLSEGVQSSIRVKQLIQLLNFRPNPFQSAQTFRRALFQDFVLEGNMFIYFDGAHLYHLPSINVVVIPDQRTLVARYEYNSAGTITKFLPDEIIHIQDSGTSSLFRGSSRLESADRSIKILYQMQDFQSQFFKNGAVAGLMLTTENTLSPKAKETTVNMWSRTYSPTNGARKPLILDSGLKPHSINQSSFQEMDFDVSIKTHDTKILKALGVPPILLDGGNNANISPNLKLFYLEAVIPIVTNLVAGLERFFGYNIAPVTNNISALQPELKEQASYFSTLVNTGILTANEAREALRYEKIADPEADKLRVPANIAGSASNPSEGGRPETEDNNE